jgi:hypothetical protein
MVPEFDLRVIDATRPITSQQREVREFVGPLLSGCLRRPVMPYGRLLEEHRLSGYYLKDQRTSPAFTRV